MTESILPLASPIPGVKGMALLFDHLKERKAVYFSGIAAVLLTNCCEVALPKCIQWCVNVIEGNQIPRLLQSGHPEGDLRNIFILLLTVLLLQAISRRRWRLTLGQETHRAAFMIKSAIWERVRLFPIRRIETDLTIGTLMNVATSDVATARVNFGWLFIGIADALFLTTLTVVAMVGINPRLAAYTGLVFVTLPITTYSLIKLQHAKHHEAQGALSLLNDLCTKAVSTLRLQKLTQTGEHWTRTLTSEADSYRKIRLQGVEISLRFLLVMEAAPLLAYALLLALSLQEVLKGSLSIGGFIAFQSYIFILQNPLYGLANAITLWQKGRASIERISEVLNVEQSGEFNNQEESVDSFDYSLTSVSFSYGSEKFQLGPLTLDIGEGERLGVQGEIGTGKSTLISLLSGAIQEFSGTITIGGREIRSLPYSSLRSSVGIVPQRPFIFSGTIRENIALDLTLSDEEIWHYLEVVSLRAEVEALPLGLNAILGEFGVNLSGGQKQRITIARALARKPRIVLLDDCLSAVDTVTEARILDALEAELEGKTVIWCAHRRSTLSRCTKILQLPSCVAEGLREEGA